MKREAKAATSSRHPHHIHALHKAAAKILHQHGHINTTHHDRIVADAERGMARAKRRGR